MLLAMICGCIWRFGTIFDYVLVFFGQNLVMYLVI